MSFLLLAVGLITAAIGLVTIGFGIPINAFSLGNTLIISGTIGVAAGLLLIGIALVLGQLRRIAEALRNRPLSRVVAESAPEVVPPQVRDVAPPAMAIQSLPELQHAEPSPPRMPEPRAPEPRFPATASEPAAPPPGPLDWLRAKAKPNAAPMTASPPPMPLPPMVEPPVVEISDEAPLSPRPPQRPAMPAPGEPALEPKVWSPNRDASGGRETVPAEPRVAPRAEQRSAPQVEPPKDKERFDLVWPDRGSAPAAAPAAAVESRVEIKREPALEMPLPPVPARPRETRPVPERRPIPEVRKPVERGPAILKSGVIDGMPYTLYADGSIEAQLPQGMVKFASVDALRAHLEKQG